MRAFALLTVGILLLGSGRAHAESSCLSKDKTGMAWIHPFAKALEKAKTETRILLIKPVAFGTTPDGGW